MKPLVQIAYDFINTLELSEVDKSLLVKMLQQGERSKNVKIEKVSKELYDEIEVLKFLLEKHLHPPKNWNGKYKGIQIK